jgi:hypothetical protein
MSSTHVYDTLRGELQDRFACGYPVVDIDTIDPLLEQREDTFLALEEISSDEASNAFGDPSNVCMLESGTFLIHVFVPAPESSRVARNVADTIRGFLRNQEFDGVRILSVSPSDPESLNDGIWTAGGVIVAYDYVFHVSLPQVAAVA